jgi:hypothetical protein
VLSHTGDFSDAEDVDKEMARKAQEAIDQGMAEDLQEQYSGEVNGGQEEKKTIKKHLHRSKSTVVRRRGGPRRIPLALVLVNLIVLWTMQTHQNLPLTASQQSRT